MSRHHPHIPYGKTVTTVKHTSRMHRLPITVATIAALTLAACSSTPHNADPASTATNTAGGGTVHSASGPTTTATLTAMSSAATAPPDPTTTSTATTTTTTTTATGVGTVSQDDLVRFIAATETVLKGTPDEGVVYASPEIYIAIAQSACARFAAGDTLQTVANDLLTQLATTNPTGDKRLVGAILGAATRTICPENSGVI